MWQRNKVQQFDSSSDFTFRWSFRPISLAMKLMSGIELFCADSGARYRKWLLRFYSGLMLVINACINFFYFATDVQDEVTLMRSASNDTQRTTIANDDQSRTNALSLAIGSLNAFVYYLGIHLSFFLTTLSVKWRSLRAILMEIEQKMNLETNFFCKVRWVAFCELFITILVYDVYIKQ